MPLLTEHDVVNMRFKTPKAVNEGYDQDEVDVFLDEVAETIAKLTKDKADLENKVKAAEARAVEAEKSAKAAPAAAAGAAPATEGVNASEATGVLALAQQLHDKYVSEGKAESDRLVSEAEGKAQGIIGDAETKYNETLAKLEQEKGLLERKISELRDFERDYRTRLKSYLESLLSSVDSGDQPKDE